jgi:hypothetical protein
MVTLVLLSSLSSWLKMKSVVSVDWTEAVLLSVGPSPDTLILGQIVGNEDRERTELVQDCAVRGESTSVECRYKLYKWYGLAIYCSALRPGEGMSFLLRRDYYLSPRLLVEVSDSYPAFFLLIATTSNKNF